MKRNLVVPRQKSLAIPDIPNPFVQKQKLTQLDKLQVAIMSVTIAPIRLIVIVLLLLMAWPIAALAVAFRSEEDKMKPMTGWRTSLRPLVLFLCRGVFFVGGFFWVKTRGTRASSRDAPILLVAPHSSFHDALPVVFLGLTSVVSKASTQDILIFGTLLEFSQPVLVKREDPDSRANTIKEIQRRAQTEGQWPQIIIFPEGTCTNRSALITFKQGAFYPGVPVQPVCVKYPNKLDTVTWTWEGPGALSQLWLTLCQFHTRIEIEYLPVYTPGQEEKENTKLFAHNVREKMAKCLKCPVTDHTFDDCRLMEKAQKLKLTPTAGLVEFEKLHTKLGLTFDQMSDLLVKFKDVKGPDKTGRTNISYEEFSRYLLLPKSDALLEVFKLYDRDGSGAIDFREYVIGLSLVSAPVNNDDTILLAFQLFDSDDKGHITKEELKTILKNAFNISELDAETIFNELDTSQDGRITLDEFKSYASRKPEYARVFLTYQELKKAMELEEQEAEKEGAALVKSSNSHIQEFEQWSRQVAQASYAKKLA